MRRSFAAEAAEGADDSDDAQKQRVEYLIPGSDEVHVRQGDSDINSHPYDIGAALLLERRPAVRRDLSDGEKLVRKLNKQRAKVTTPPWPTALKESLPDDHPLRARKKKLLAPRKTLEDASKDLTSQNRQLGDYLYLIVRTNSPYSPYPSPSTNSKGKTSKKSDSNGSKQHWQFPQGLRNFDETIHETAERQAERFGSSLKHYMLGARPITHFQHDFKSGKNGKEGKKGVKVFLHRSQFLAGDIDLSSSNNDDIAEYAWVNKHQMQEYLEPSVYEEIRELLN